MSETSRIRATGWREEGGREREREREREAERERTGDGQE